VAVAQLFVPLALIAGISSAAVKLPVHRVHLSYAGFMWLPFIAAAAVLAWLYMDSLTQAKADTSSYVSALRHPQTWVMSFLYIGTFGSFIGFSFALPLVIKNTFPEFLGHHPFIATYLAGLGFMGALLGSVSRPIGGQLADRIGGARVTVVVFLGMAIATAVAIVGVSHRSFGVFFGSYMAVFVLAGMGNGSTYKMIPSIFAHLGQKEAEATGADLKVAAVESKRRAAAVIGIAGAIGAFGGVLIQVVLRQASLSVSALVKAAATPADKVAIAAAHSDWSVPALWVFLGSYVVFAGVTWFVYLRTTFAARAATPTLAGASI
jgi:NNP family nitrate/nitrite transporter-like MFS transporter